MVGKSPWQCNDEAFEIMFSDNAEFSLVSGERATLQCCVFPKEDVDPFAESDNESTIMSATILVKKSDWCFSVKAPSVGDKITLPNGDKYKITTIKNEQNWYRLEGRSFGR